MAKMIQIRNVPDHIHRLLKARSALSGKSMSELILQELEAMVALPSEDELRERLQQAKPFAMQTSSAEFIRKDRDAA